MPPSRDEQIEKLTEAVNALVQAQSERGADVTTLRVPFGAYVVSLLFAVSTFGGFYGNYHRINSHVENKYVHIDQDKATNLGGVAFQADVRQSAERLFSRVRGVLNTCHVSAEPGSNKVWCSELYSE